MPALIADWKRRRMKLLTTTARRIAARLDLDWSAVARRDVTAVVHQPADGYAVVADAAICSGRPAYARCFIVSSVGRPDQQIFTTTLRHLASVSGLPAPAIVIIKDSLPAPKNELASQFCRQIVGAAANGTGGLDTLGRSSGDPS